LSPRKPEPRLYNRLAVLRAERGLSRQDLADAVDVNYQTIGYLERGEYNPSLDLAFKIAELFGVPIEAVFSREPLPPMSARLYGRPDAETEPA
jgi:DNA-binding XRE family transcriptional regulator